MLILNEASQVLGWVTAYRAAHLRVGFVPTMGALHEGHLSLIRAARQECERLIVSIFVNPLQFGPSEDLERYPRHFERDREICESEGVDLLYHGNERDFYPENFQTSVRVKELTKTLCGRSRPWHFEGVCTVVAKLFLRTLPHVAYFGQKDLQQAQVVKRMVKDLDIPVSVKVLPTVRESDGLAVSSRNSYLTGDERRAATCLWRGLCESKRLWERGERRAGPLKEACRAVIEAEPLAALDYAEVVETDSMRELADGEEAGGEGAALVAVRIGNARLIDNVLLRQ